MNFNGIPREKKTVKGELDYSVLPRLHHGCRYGI